MKTLAKYFRLVRLCPSRMRPSKLFIIVLCTRQWQPVFILIISNSTFLMQWSLLPGGKKLEIPSTSRTAAAWCGAPLKNLLSGLQAPLVCALFQHIPLLHSSCRTGHTRRGIASPRGSLTSSWPTYGRFQHLMEIPLVSLSQMSFLTLSTTWSRENPWD